MCGVVGIVNLKNGCEIDRGLLSRMNDLQYHRGPDEGGIHVEQNVGFGHRRLSIIDRSGGQQPLFNEDESVVVVYNGEIYNFQTLAEELKASGHIFRTHCDTEVIVHAWEEWGEACVDHFRGMFAFAIWDRNKQTLFLARDRLGIKPLYYAELECGSIIFASELKALLAHPELKRELDYYAVEEYFALGYVPDPRTILKHAKKLSPGHTLTCRLGQSVPREKMYWDVSFSESNGDDEQSLQDELIQRLDEAVDIRLIAEVPLGAFLSGGVDSSAIVALMSKHTKGDLNTCSIGFDDPAYTETQYAQLVADQFKTNHHVEQVSSNDFDLLDKLGSLYDEPFADSSAIPTYRVCEMARKHVVVALSGDGGDELFAGYRRHRWHMNEEKVRNLLPYSIRRPLFGTLGRVYPKLDWAPRIFRGKSTFQSLGRDTLSAYMHTVSVVYDDLRENLYSDKLKSELQGYTADQVFRRHAENAPSDHPLSLIQYVDMKTYLPGDILTKVDRASMAHSLEVRVPLLDHKFVEWASGIPPELMLKGREGKYIFKKSLGSQLPHDVLYRDKMGFGVPLEGWFRGPLKERVREAIASQADTGLFNGDYLLKLVDEHQSGRREHSATLWSLLMFDTFYKQTFS